jgi:pyruvate, orthophosphate dikinase
VTPAVVTLDGRTGASRAVLGGKAWSIEWLRALGLPVPEAFVLTTDVCHRFYAAEGMPAADGLPATDVLAGRDVTAARDLPADVWPQVSAAMERLEARTGRRFGHGERPLLVAVRSGAAVSMPGMMDTILNLGMTDRVERALAEATGDAGYAADTRRRFAAQFRTIVGRPAPDDPGEQLRLAVLAVLESWRSRRAVRYRRDRGIPEQGGTAVIVQRMVFGNLDARSGTGVLFSRNPLTGSAEPYGEWLPRGQGEEVVSGRSDALPLAALGESMPQVHASLLAAAARLERDGRDVQDVEFTVEAGRLWLLQSRAARCSPEAVVRHSAQLCREGLIGPGEALGRITPEQIEQLLAPRPDPMAVRTARVLARGKPACPGTAVGIVVTDADEAEERADEGVVLARPTTDPDDVPAMSVSRGVVTEHGGSTSHAAVVCRELALPCVVGCGTGTLAGLAGRTVTVDAGLGVIYDGALPIVSPAAPDDPDLITLTGWARQEQGDAGTLPELLRARAIGHRNPGSH